MVRKPTASTKTKSRVTKTSPNLPQHNLSAPYDKLMTMGEEEDLDVYLSFAKLAEKGSADDVVATLVSIATDQAYYTYGDPNAATPDPRQFAPLNAVRALGFVPEAAFGAFDQIVPLFASTDDVLRETLPVVFACMGEVAIAPLTAILLNAEADVNLRDGAADSLVEICTVTEDKDSEVAETITKVLSESSDFELNAYLVFDLMDLDYSDALPVIEFAFQEGRIDNDILTLEEVQEYFESVDEDASDTGDDVPSVADDQDDDEEYQEPYVAPVTPGRNDPCYCGSGKKYKKCHGGNAQ